MMYTYANNVLPLAINYLFTTTSDVHNYTTRITYYMSIRVILISTKKLTASSARIWNAMQSEIEVNVSISKFKISSKTYLQ